MLITSVRVNEITGWKKKRKKRRQKGTKGWCKCSISMGAKCFAFKLGFLPLICKASLISKSNLELALLIILRQRELYESNHVVGECRCSKIWDLPFFLIFSSILVLKWQFLPV